jgi:hypothetical protein
MWGFSVRWRGEWMLNSMWPFWREDCYRTWKFVEFLQMKSFSSKIMIRSIPLKEPRSDLWSKISSFGTGLLNLQTLTPLNTLGVISKNVFQDMRGLPQGFINYGIEWG